ncbi:MULTISPECIES: quinol oxidase subunit 4 [Chryseobacterium]
MFMLSSCVVHDNGARGNTIPPGQAKKVFGGSAKDYAPGQVKKRSGY